METSPPSTLLEQAELLVQQQLDRLAEALAAQRDEVKGLRDERDALAASLAETESRLAEASSEDRRADVEAGGFDAAAIEQTLNSDAIVQQERERLQRLQEQWREKLRQAEIELSVERAKIARQRAELAGELRTAEGGLSALPSVGGSPGPAVRPASGRWLARLGLTEADKEPRRR